MRCWRRTYNDYWCFWLQLLVVASDQIEYSAQLAVMPSWAWWWIPNDVLFQVVLIAYYYNRGMAYYFVGQPSSGGFRARSVSSGTFGWCEFSTLSRWKRANVDQKKKEWPRHLPPFLAVDSSIELRMHMWFSIWNVPYFCCLSFSLSLHSFWGCYFSLLLSSEQWCCCISIKSYHVRSVVAVSHSQVQ